MTRLEVRCCCQPQKLRGWLDVPEHAVKNGGVAVFPLRTPPNARWDAPFETVRLEVARMVKGTKDWLAVKSEDLPLETLRRIHGFVEAGGQ